MTAADIVHTAIASDRGDDFDTHALEIVADNPSFARDVEIAKQVDADRADAGRIARADQSINRFAGRAITILFRALESFTRDGENRNTFCGRNLFADRSNIVANHTNDTGRVNKRGLGLMLFDQLHKRAFEFFLAAVDDIHLLHISGKTVAV